MSKGQKIERHTLRLLHWFEREAEAHAGILPRFSNVESAQVLGRTDMATFGRALGNVQSRIDFACYRLGLPPLGLVADKAFAKAWNTQGRAWSFPIEAMRQAARNHIWTADDFSRLKAAVSALPAQAYQSWQPEIREREASIRSWAFGLGGQSDTPYWVFVCNPKFWAIDRFLEQRIEYDTWGVRDSDRFRFSPGQLGFIRVGVDQRSIRERAGRPKLAAGIYAVCEVESTAYEAAGANSEFWSEDHRPAAGRPTVDIRYLRTFSNNPLTIEELRRRAPHLSSQVLDGFQARSFPISQADFSTIARMLGLDMETISTFEEREAITTADRLAELEKRYLNANPEKKSRVSKVVERGPVGDAVKRAREYKCQVCDALGREAVGFRKKDGEPYIEAHHVMPVSHGQVGSLSASNVMTVCANHHRQIHYQPITISIEGSSFNMNLDGRALVVPRFDFSRPFA